MKVIYNFKLIENFMREKSLTKLGFCKLCGISLSTFNGIKNNAINLRFRTLIKIMETTKISADDFMWLDD